ncbi:MAG: VTT domain-containing protein [Sulfitobacter sp.]|nr:VTT domain-containing protein [Sulfitobacter sp.]
MAPMTDSNHKRSGFGRYLPLIVIAVVAAVGAFTLQDHINFDALRDNREALLAFRDSNFALTVFGFIVFYILIVAFSLPGAAITSLTGGFLFGTLFGTLVNMTGATIGAIVIFQAARMGLGEALKARIDASEGLIARLKTGIDENQWSMLFFIRFVPAVPFFVANLIPAFLAVPLYRFAISTFLGIIPGTLVITSVGAGLGQVFETDEAPNLGIFFEPHILLPILGLTVLSLVPVAVKLFTGKKDILK